MTMKTKDFIILVLMFIIAYLLIKMFAYHENEPIVTKPVEIKHTKILELPEETINLINGFRPAVKDVIVYILTNKDKMNHDKFYFKCGRYSFWIANDYYYFKLESNKIPVELSHDEKLFLYGIYLDYMEDYKNTNRLYHWENDVKIKQLK